MAISAASIRNQVKRAFAAMGDVAQSLTYRYPASAYTRNARYELEITWTSITVRGIVTQFTRKEIDMAGGTIGVGDRKIYVSQEGLSVEITTYGEFIIDGSIYTVTDVQTDPAGAMYLCTAQESGKYVAPPEPDEPEPDPDPEPEP